MLPAWEHPDRIAPVRVLQVSLRGPVTLGHVLLLDEIGSPVVTGEEFGIGDLALAVLICSEPTEQAARKTMGAWWAEWVLLFWGRRCGKLDFAEESKRFADWFTAQCGGPERMTIVKDGGQPQKPLSAPWYINKLGTAVGEMGLSIDEACALPVKRLNQLLAAIYEQRGDAEYLSNEQAKFFENVKRWEAEKKGAVA